MPETSHPGPFSAGPRIAMVPDEPFVVPSAMDPIHLRVEGRQFEKSYLVYVVILTAEDGARFYYVGQTGDRHYRTARPAFSRLAAHLDAQGSSTQNQVYRAIATKILGYSHEGRSAFPPELKEAVTQYLSTSTIDMYAFPVLAFDQAPSAEEHRPKVAFVELVEQNVLARLRSEHGQGSILNKRIGTAMPDSVADSIVSDITRYLRDAT